MVVADLHVHTTNSDGTLTLEGLPAAAREVGLEAVAVTDHDRISPDLDEPVSTLDGVTVIHGIELRVRAGELRVDLLGYGVRPTDELTALLASLQQNRVERAREMVASVEDRLGVSLDVTFEPGVGRPHVARAVAESDHEYGYDAAFSHLIGDGGPCYVARDIPRFEEGRRVLARACGVVGLAHPFRYPDPEAALGLLAHLDAVELYYPYGRPVDTRPAERAVAEYELLVTGGSDAHGETLGTEGLDREAFRAVRERLA